MNIGEELRKIRKARGLTQAYVADRASIDHKLISHWETGRHLPRIDLVIDLLEAMGYRMDFVPKTERLNGRWVERYIESDDCKWTRRRFYCSVCGDWQTYGKPKYCPSCGSKMKEE